MSFYWYFDDFISFVSTKVYRVNSIVAEPVRCVFFLTLEKLSRYTHILSLRGLVLVGKLPWGSQLIVAGSMQVHGKNLFMKNYRIIRKLRI